MYERFFGLVDAPFRLTPDPRYLFLSRKHADALAHLRLGLSESSGFVCITGDVGTGKTTVLRHFLGELAPESSVAYVVNPTLSPLELLQTINAEFGLPARRTSKKELIDHLNRHLLAQREAGSRAVVVVDEAQALSMEVLEHLRLLSNLETTTEKLLRIILVGQPQLRALLAHPELAQLNQRITLRWHIGPLDREETMAYVRHRLEIASEGQVRDVFSGVRAARRPRSLARRPAPDQHARPSRDAGGVRGRAPHRHAGLGAASLSRGGDTPAARPAVEGTSRGVDERRPRRGRCGARGGGRRGRAAAAADRAPGGDEGIAASRRRARAGAIRDGGAAGTRCRTGARARRSSGTGALGHQ